MSKKCEGMCCFNHNDNADREVRTVRVVSNGGRDWGEFTYCDEAVEIDQDNGFTVLPVEFKGDDYAE